MRVIDMHCDTVSALLDGKKRGLEAQLRRNDFHIDLERMRESRYMVQNFALFVALGQDGDPWERVLELYGYYREELERNRDIIAPVYRFSDIRKNDEAGRISALLTVEEGAVCKGDPEKLQKLYEMGVRMLTLTWNFDNELGHPNFDGGLKEKWKKAFEAWKNCGEGDPAGEAQGQEGSPAGKTDGREAHCRPEQSRAAYRALAQEARDAYLHTPNLLGGLTKRGREFVAQMEMLGMIPDVSHLSDAGFYDVLETAKKPFVASHSNARAVCPNVRNLTDDMIRRLSERGGVMGLNFCADFLEEKSLGEKNSGTIEAVIRHAKHIVSVGGVEVLGLGSDFDGIGTHKELPGAQAMETLWQRLHRAEFTEDQLDKIFYKNVLRVYGDTLK